MHDNGLFKVDISSTGLGAGVGYPHSGFGIDGGGGEFLFLTNTTLSLYQWVWQKCRWTIATLAFYSSTVQVAIMEVLVLALGALETKSVDFWIKALAGWEVELEEDMETILETWVVEMWQWQFRSWGARLTVAKPHYAQQVGVFRCLLSVQVSFKHPSLQLQVRNILDQTKVGGGRKLCVSNSRVEVFLNNKVCTQRLVEQFLEFVQGCKNDQYSPC